MNSSVCNWLFRLYSAFTDYAAENHKWKRGIWGTGCGRLTLYTFKQNMVG